MKYLKLIPSVSLLAIATMHAAAANAQAEQPAPAPEKGIAEIVVTAQKRAELLSKTAAAISVIGQATLDNTGARSFKDAVNTLPNVSAAALGGNIAIRGLGTATIKATNGTVAYHIDGIYQNSTNQSNATLYDIARVEVLRGPQGTLYGRNATAGVVNVITNNANLDEVEAFGDVSYGRWNSLQVRGAVNIPLTDSFAVRATGTYEKSDDWKHFANGDHPNSRDVLNLRLAWRAKPSDRITWDGRVDYLRNNSVLISATPTYTYDKVNSRFVKSANDPSVADLPPGTGTNGLAVFGLTGILPSVYKGLTYEQANKRPSRTFAVRSNLNFELSDDLSLTYLAGYSQQRDIPGVIAGLQPYQVNSSGTSKANSWSHELNLNYESEKLKAVLGAYSYQNVSFSSDNITRIFAQSVKNGAIVYDTPSVDFSGAASGPDKITTRAIFGQATYDVTDRLRLTGGVRYNWDRASFATTSTRSCPFGSGLIGSQPDAATFLGMPWCDFAASSAAVPTLTAYLTPVFAQQVGPVFAPFAAGLVANAIHGTAGPTVIRPGGAKSFEKFSWKGTVEYDLAPDTMAYATVATGYKAGGKGDVGAVGDARFFRPETNTNYEVGIRSKLFDNTLSLNLTAFWTDYKDLQTETPGSLPGVFVLSNLGKSRSRGLELEYVWAPTAADRINGYLSYLDAKVLDFPSIDPLTGITSNFAGNRLPGAPKFSGRVSYSHTFDLGGAGTITPTASLFYQTKSYTLFTNNLPSRVPAYTRSDVIVRYETENKHFSLEGYVNNIENKIVMAGLFPELGASNAFFSPPRSYGVRLGFRY